MRHNVLSTGRLRSMQAVDDGEEVTVIDGQQSVPDEEVDQHKIAVVFELVSVANRFVHALHRPQLESVDFTVVRPRSEVVRQLEVEAGHDVGL